MPIRLSRIPSTLLLLAAAATLAGCASDRSRSGFLEPYRFAIPQGNYINQQMLDEVHTGMAPDEVRLRIGTPLLADVFHPNRWEYVFRFQYPNGDSELRRVTVFFADGRVSDIKHDRLPERDDPNDPALPGYQPTERHVNS
ncbi:MAG: outer membrane protein assembly factor BamE [Lautropia mirabilis]|nr:outer membrane protein assembly factor BamE [Lautropia mirabilis]